MSEPVRFNWGLASAGVAIAFLGAVWSFGDHYLTIREHEEFKQRTDATLRSLQDQVNAHTRTDAKEYLNRDEFDRWVHERNNLIGKLRDDISRLENTRPTTSEVKESVNAVEIRLMHLERLLLPAKP